MDDLSSLLQLLPKSISEYIKKNTVQNILVEIVLDLGFAPELRFDQGHTRLKELGEVTQDQIDDIVSKIGVFNTDNRAGIQRTLHRISAIRNRHGKIIGLTCRIGRPLTGTADLILDVIKSGKNCLFLGPPGVGKTTLLREVARVLSENRRVIVVDTSNEIAGDGDIAHPAIGFARRMQVPSPDQQHAIMIEAVENHMPEVIIIDEIGTQAETQAARTIAERGVQLIATAHGQSQENLIKNPELSDLIGGIQAVILGDEEAKFRGTNKTIVERKFSPTFDILIEIRDRQYFAIYDPVDAYVDAFLKEDPIDPEIRSLASPEEKELNPFQEKIKKIKKVEVVEFCIFVYGIQFEKVQALIEQLKVPARVVSQLSEADCVLTTKSMVKNRSKLNQMSPQVPIHVLNQNSESSIISFLQKKFKLQSFLNQEEQALQEVESAIEWIQKQKKTKKVSPQSAYIRKLQHERVKEYGFFSTSVGKEPNRALKIYFKN